MSNAPYGLGCYYVPRLGKPTVENASAYSPNKPFVSPAELDLGASILGDE